MRYLPIYAGRPRLTIRIAILLIPFIGGCVKGPHTDGERIGSDISLGELGKGNADGKGHAEPYGGGDPSQDQAKLVNLVVSTLTNSSARPLSVFNTDRALGLDFDTRSNRRYMEKVATAVLDKNDGFVGFITAPSNIEDGNDIHVYTGKDGSRIHSFAATTNKSSATPYAYGIAAGHLDGDSLADIAVVVNGATNSSEIRVFSQSGETLSTFFPCGNSFPHRLARVAVADMDDDGIDEIIVFPAVRDGCPLKIFRSNGELVRNVPLDIMHDGMWVAAGDVNADGHNDLIVAAFTQVRVYDGLTGQLFYSFTPFTESGTANRSVMVASLDVDGDQKFDIICTQVGRAGAADGGQDYRVRIYSGANPQVLLQEYYPFPGLVAWGISISAVRGRFFLP